MTLRSFGSYELLKRFAIGGMSELWFALPKERRGDNRPRVLKRMLPHLAEDPDAVELFLQEAKRGAHLQHENIVRIFEFGAVQGLHYLLREFIQGESLDGVLLLAQRKPSVLTPERALHILASVCEALAHAYHSRGLTHGELTTRNILMGSDGAVKVMGFLGTKVSDPRFLRRGAILPNRLEGTAPEQVLGKPMDHRTDVFAAGVVLYELLTGLRPLWRDSALDMVKALHECQIAPPSQVAPVPPALDALVMKALARAPEDRYPDARDFQRALEAYLTAQWAQSGSESLAAMMWRLTSSEGGSC